MPDSDMQLHAGQHIREYRLYRLKWEVEYLYARAYPNKEHLYSKNFTRARKTYITILLNQGVYGVLMKPSPPPCFGGASPLFSGVEPGGA